MATRSNLAVVPLPFLCPASRCHAHRVCHIHGGCPSHSRTRRFHASRTGTSSTHSGRPARLPPTSTTRTFRQTSRQRRLWRCSRLAEAVERHSASLSSSAFWHLQSHHRPPCLKHQQSPQTFSLELQGAQATSKLQLSPWCIRVGVAKTRQERVRETFAKC